MNWYTVDEEDVAGTVDDTARAVYEPAAQVGELANAVRALGNGDAATRMGAIEAFGVVMKDGMERLANAIETRGEP